MWKKFEIYSIQNLALVRKGRAFYATLYQVVFFGNPEGGVSLSLANRFRSINCERKLQ